MAEAEQTKASSVRLPTPEDFGYDWPDDVGCQSWAEKVNELNPHLRLTYGLTRSLGEEEWGDHAWNTTQDGQVIDGFYTAHPYFQHVNEPSLEYREDPQTAFEGFYHEGALMQWAKQPQPQQGVPVPDSEQRFGKTVVRWWEGAPGEVVIMAHGGSCDDRTLAEQLVAFDLANCGYKRMAFTFDMPRELHKHASWDDIMAKAIRLIRSGNVHLLRNGYHNIVGHVIGDHGEYNSEIGRDDPNSRAITTWQCECPWDQYAWQRTRKWKKYEGRPCAHVLALYWKSRMTPLDEDYDPSQGPQEPGQKQPEPVPAPATDDMGNPIGPGAGGDEQAQAPAPPPQSMGSPPPSGGPMGPPAPSGVLPMSPMEQLQMMQPPMPGQTPNGMPAPPNSVSVPGARIPTPFNPIQYPGGTYSHKASEPPNYHVQKDPDTKRCGTCTMFDEGKCWGYGNRAVSSKGVCDSYTQDKRVSKTPFGITVHAADFTNGQRVKAKDELFGITEGREGATDAGQYVPVAAGERGEVIGQDEATGWVEVIFPLSGGPMTSYHVRCFCEPSQLMPLQGGTPFIQRRH